MSAVCVWLTDDHRRGHHLRGRSCHAGGEVDPRGGRRGTAGQGRTEAAGPRGAQGVRATDARGAQHGVRHGQDGDGHRQPAAGDADLAGGRRCVRALFPPSLSPLALFALHSQGNGVQRSALSACVGCSRALTYASPLHNCQELFRTQQEEMDIQRNPLLAAAHRAASGTAAQRAYVRGVTPQGHIHTQCPTSGCA